MQTRRNIRASLQNRIPYNPGNAFRFISLLLVLSLFSLDGYSQADYLRSDDRTVGTSVKIQIYGLNYNYCIDGDIDSVRRNNYTSQAAWWDGPGIVGAPFYDLWDPDAVWAKFDPGQAYIDIGSPAPTSMPVTFEVVNYRIYDHFYNVTLHHPDEYEITLDLGDDSIKCVGDAYLSFDSDMVTITNGGDFNDGAFYVDGSEATGFDPGTMGAGRYEVVYGFLDGACSSFRDTNYITVYPLPTVTFSAVAPVCVNNATFSLVSYASPAGGTFSGVGVSGGNQFDPATAGVGSHTVVYTYSDGKGCENTAQRLITVNGLPTVSLSGLNADYCNNDGSDLLTGNHAPDGTFTGTGITDNSNGTATYDPTVPTPGGPYTITYTYTDGNGCTHSGTDQTTILSLPTGNISGNETICIGSSGDLTLTMTSTGPYDFTYNNGTSDTDVTGVASPYTLSLSPATTTSYTLVSVTQANGCTVSGTGTGVINVNPLSTIVTHPDNETACPGDNVILTVAASGVGLTFQWKKGGTAISGATSTNLNLNNVDATDAGVYTCVVSSSCGPPLTSDPATLTVLETTAITDQPDDVTDCEDENISFTVGTAGTSNTFQWRKAGLDISNGGDITGATSNNLNIASIATGDEGAYTVFVQGTCGTALTNPASLAVNDDIVITSQPSPANRCPGTSVTFSVTVTGTSPAFQWKLDGSNIAGATFSSITIPGVDAADAGNYTCVITGTCNSVTTNPALLTVYEDVDIFLQPITVNTCEDLTANFDIDATGTNLDYQWVLDGTPLVDGARITGSDTKNLEITLLTPADAGGYYCEVTGLCGNETSSNATLTVDERINITTQPSAQDYCELDDFVLSVAASGTNLKYQWYNDAGLIAGASNANLPFVDADASDEGAYYAFVSNDCPAKTSTSVDLTMKSPTLLLASPTDDVICESENVTFSVSASGSGLSYQWTLDGGNITDAGKYTGSLTNSLLISNADISYAGAYACEISGFCGNESSGQADLTINQSVVIITQPSGKSLCPGSNTSFSVTVSGTSPTFQWKKDNVNITGATSSVLSLTDIDASDAGTYKCVITNSCNSVTSTQVTLTVYEQLSITLQPVSVNACQDETVNFSVSASGTILGYQWRNGGTDLSDGIRTTGSNATALEITNLDPVDAGGYTCEVTGQCGNLTSVSASLIVDEKISITTNPVSQEFCELDDVVLNVVASGTNKSYQWYKNAGTMAGRTSSVLTLSDADAGDIGSYYCIISNYCTPKTSSTALLLMNDPTVLVSEPSDDISCTGDNVSMEVTVTGSNLTYSWNYNGGDINDLGKYSGTSSKTLLISGIDGTYAGAYNCDISGSCGDVSSNAANLTVNDPIAFATHPTSKSLCEGSNTSFTVTVTGTNPSYQWQRNGTNISGATSNTLALTGITPANAGTYKCIVTGSCNTLTSNQAALTVYETTIISTQPVEVNTCEGTAANFSVLAMGTINSYNWRKGSTNLTDGSGISGATTPYLTLNSLDASQTGSYNCVITGQCNTLSSDNAALVVDEAITVTDDPLDTEYCESDYVVLAVTASGTNLGYQWYKDAAAIPGESSTNLILSGADATDEGDYFVRVTNYCTPKNSLAATLTMNDPTLITVQPSGDVICTGDNTNLSLVSTGTYLTYAWSLDGAPISDGGSYTGTNSSTLTISSASVAEDGIYVCEVSGFCGNETTNQTTLTVNTPISISSQPTAKSVCPGDNTSFSVSVTGTAPTYQWYKDGIAIAGQTSNLLTLNSVAASDQGKYKCTITGACNTVSSSEVNLLVYVPVAITSQPASLSSCVGSTANLNATVTGAVVAYQWRKGASNLTDGGDIIGSFTPFLTLLNMDAADAGSYTLLVTGHCSNLTSGTATLVVDEPIGITEEPADQEYCEGEDLFLTLSVTGTNLNYQWYKESTVITGETGSELVLSAADAGDEGDYYCEITNNCTPVSTSEATLTMNYPTMISAEPSDDVVCEGENASLFVTASGSALNFSWTLDGSAISDTGKYLGTNSNILLISSVDESYDGLYVCTVTGGCGSVSTNPAELTVNVPITISTQPTNKSVCPGSNTSFNVTVTGTSPTYQWKKGTTNIGANSATLSLNSIDASNADSYKVTVTGSCGAKTSNTATLTVYEEVVITTQPTGASTCEGLSKEFSVGATGSILGYQWRKNGLDVANGGDISGATGTNMTISNLEYADGGNYAVLIDGRCGDVQSDPAIMVVDESIVITTEPTSFVGCEGENIIISVIASGTNLNYKWYKNGSTVSGGTNADLVFTNVTSANEGAYYCLLSNSCVPQVTNLANITLNDATTIITEPTDKTVCEESNTNIAVSASGTNLSYQWSLDGNPLSNGGAFSGVTASTLLISSATTTYGGVYICEISGDCGNVETNPMVLTVNELVSITDHPDSKTVCPGTNVQFEIAAEGSELSYQWLLDGIAISGATGNSIVLNDVEDTDEGKYRCRVTGFCETKLSNEATLTLYDTIAIITQPTSQSICDGNNATFNVSATGESLAYQWKRNGTTLTNGGQISGANSSTMVINNLVTANEAIYSCQISNVCGNKSTIPANLEISENLIITTQPVVYYAVDGGNASFSVVAGGDVSSYQWYKSGGGGGILSDDAVFSGTSTSILTIRGVTLANAGGYYCILDGICGDEVTSSSGQLNVNLTSLIQTHPSDGGNKCEMESVTFDVIIKAGITGVVYQWKKDGVNLVDDGSRIDGSNDASLTIDVLEPDDEGSYSCLITADQGIENSFPAGLIVNQQTDVTLQPQNATICEGEDALFVINAKGDGLTFQWKKGSTAVTDGARIDGAGTPTLTISNSMTADAGVYTCEVTGGTGCGSDVSDGATLVVNEIVDISSNPVSKTRCEGTSASFSVVASGTSITYQWRKGSTNLLNDSRISGANSKDLNIANLSNADAGSYSCSVSGPCGTENSLVASLIISPVTNITKMPIDKQLCEDDDAVFSIVATGLNLTYEWRLDGTPLVNNGTHIEGADEDILIITNLVPGDAGLYECYVDGYCNDLLSSTGELVVNENVEIIAQPQDVSRCVGNSATFSVSVANPLNTYQWKKNGVKLVNAGNIAGVNSATLTIGSVTTASAGVYSCLVTGECDSINTSLATLIILPTTAVTNQPLSQEVDEGSPVTFTVAASGSNLSYQWYKNDVPLPGQTTNVLTVSSPVNTDEGGYTCLVTGTCGSILSDPATLIVNEPTIITTQPGNKVICEEGNISFTLAATGENLTYQWMKDGTDLVNTAAHISGASSPILSLTNIVLSDVGAYTCLVSGDGGDATTDVVTLEVNPLTAITVNPQATKLICEGQETLFAVSATGHDLTYQWKKANSALVEGGNISGSTSRVLELSNLDITYEGEYTVMVSGTCGTKTSGPSVLSINELVEILTEPSNATRCAGQAVQFTVSSADPTNTFKWKKNGLILSNNGNISGATSPTLAIDNLTVADAGIYSCAVIGECDSLNSSLATLTILESSVITSQPASQEVGEGMPVTFMVEANGDGLSYQWYKNEVPIAGATTSIYTIASPVNSSEGAYTVVVSGTCDGTTSDPANLVVNRATSITSQPTSKTLCEGLSTSFVLIADGENLSYQWRKDGIPLSNNVGKIIGAKSSTLTITGLDASDVGAFTCVVNGSGGTLTSNVVTLAVNPTTSINTNPAALKIVCEGGEAIFVVDATGVNLSYAWKKDNIALPEGGNITGSTSDILTVSNITSADAGDYTVMITSVSGCGVITSSTSSLEVNELVNILSQPSDATKCAGSSVTFTTSSLDPGNTFQWKRNGIKLSNNGRINGVKTTTLSIQNLAAADAGTYSCLVSGECDSINTTLAALTVLQSTVITDQPISQLVNEGTAVTFNLEAEGSSLIYQWYKDEVIIAGATNSSYSIASPVNSDEGDYTCVVSGNCNTVTSDPATLIVNIITTITNEPTSKVLCEGENAAFSVTVNGESLNYEWRLDGVALVNEAGKISGVKTSNLSVSSVEMDDAGAYSCQITGAGGNVTSEVIILSVNQTTIINTHPVGEKELCSGKDAIFTVSAQGYNLSYQWKKANISISDGDNISGTNQEILTVSDVTSGDNGQYTVTVTGSCGIVTSNPSTLTVNDFPLNPGTITGATLLCQGDNQQIFEVPAITKASSYEWLLPYGATIQGDATTRQILVNFDLDAIGGNIIVQGKNACGVGPKSTAHSVTINLKPDANAGTDQSICYSNTTLLANNNPNGTWKVEAGSATITDNTSYNTALTNIGRGDNLLVWTVNELNCSSADTVMITNNRVLLNAGPDQRLCSSSATTNASEVTVGTGHWNVISGGAAILNPAKPVSGVEGLIKGTTQLEWTITNNGCISRDTMELINDIPSTAYAGKDTILTVDSYIMQADIPVIGVGVWSLVSGSGTISSTLMSNTGVYKLGFGENEFKWTVTNNDCVDGDEVSIINCLPTSAYAGENQTICYDSTRLLANKPEFGTGSWSVVQGNALFKDVNDRATDVVEIGPGVNVLRWTVKNLCETIYDDVTITNNSPSIANAGINQTLCDDSTNLQASQPLIGSGTWQILGGSGTLANENLYNSSITNLAQGATTLRWTVINAGCSSSDEVLINNNIPTTANAGVDQLTCADSIQLFPNTPTVGKGEWSVIDGSAVFEGNMAYNLSTDENILKYSILYKGCISSDTIIITSHKPTTASTPVFRSICVDTSELNGSIPAVGTGQWTILSGSATFEDNSYGRTLARDIAFGTSRLRWTITYKGCTSYSDVTLSYDLINAEAGDDQTLCESSAIMTGNDPATGKGRWTVVGGGSAVFADPTLANSEVSGLRRGDNTLRWTITKGTCVSYDQVVVTNNLPSEADAKNNRTICGESIFMNANTPGIGTGEWLVLEGSATIDLVSNPAAEVDNLSLGKNILRWQIENKGCIDYDDIEITNNQPAYVNAGEDQYLCSTATQLFAEPVVGGSGKWSIAAGSAVFVNNTSFDTDVTGLTRGDNLLVWMITIGGCSNADTILVANNLPTQPVAGPDQDICNSDILMAANLPTIGTGRWSIVSGAAEFDDPTDAFTRVTSIGNGENVISWNTSYLGCNLSDEITITNSLPTVAYAGEDREICNNVASLLANNPNAGTGSWTVVSGFGIFDDPNAYNTQISMLGFGRNTLRWTTVKGRCNSSDDVIIWNNLAHVNAGVDEIVYQPSVQLNGNNPQAGTGEWQFVAGEGDITDPNNFETKVTNLGEGANTLEWTINNKGCIATDNVIITYYILPEVDFQPSPPGGCPPLEVDFINGSVGGAPFSWNFGDGSVSGEDNPLHTFDSPGEYTVTLTATGPNGILITKDALVIVHEQPVAIPEVRPDHVYITNPPGDNGPEVRFYNESFYSEKVLWDFGDGTTSEENNPRHIYTQVGVYDVMLYVESEYQCNDSETLLSAVTVEEKGSLECPNVFTPNMGGETGGYVDFKDESNDVFHCFAEKLNNYQLEIYNRQGILMFETEDVNIGWDGYFRGKIAPEGVYVYRITGKYNNGEDFSQLGSVMILYNK